MLKHRIARPLRLTVTGPAIDRALIGKPCGLNAPHVILDRVIPEIAEISGIDPACLENAVLQALLMAVWRRKPKNQVLIHSDQGSQFTSMDWAAFLKHHNLVHSMSRRGNCHDNAVAESFFNLLKRERIRRRVYRSRDEARQDVFDYIEMFYNPKRKHVRNGMLSPVEFEKQQKI